MSECPLYGEHELEPIEPLFTVPQPEPYPMPPALEVVPIKVYPRVGRYPMPPWAQEGWA